MGNFFTTIERLLASLEMRGVDIDDAEAIWSEEDGGYFEILIHDDESGHEYYFEGKPRVELEEDLTFAKIKVRGSS